MQFFMRLCYTLVATWSIVCLAHSEGALKNSLEGLGLSSDDKTEIRTLAESSSGPGKKQSVESVKLETFCRVAGEVASDNGFGTFWETKTSEFCQSSDSSPYAKAAIHSLLQKVLINGVTYLDAPDKVWGETEPSVEDSGDSFRQLSSAEDLRRVWSAFEPKHAQYQALKAALGKSLNSRHQSVGDGTSDELPEVLKEGDCHPGVAKLRERLNLKSLQEKAPSESNGDQTTTANCVGKDFIAGVKQLQRNHNLKADGIYGPSTKALLTTSPKAFGDKIKVNMERWRWLPQDFAGDFALVNVADYKMIYGSAKDERTMAVIVGKEASKTNRFYDSIEYLVFNPWWNIPMSIARDEILPKEDKNPGYMDGKNYVPYRNGQPVSISEFRNDSSVRLRQKPGAGNALGRIKFIFPNQHAIYLHDTSNDSLFDKSQRAFSHGCIRIEEPVKFAEWLLSRNKKQWSADKIRAKIDSEKNTRVNLDSEVPVYIGYWSLSVEQDGEVTNIPDLYELDAPVLERLGLSVEK